jgi:hypothetical protein
MKKFSKIILSTSFAAALLVGCGGGSADPLAEAQDIAKNFKGVWVTDSKDGGIKGCTNDVEDGESEYTKVTIDNKFVVDIKEYSELNCDPSKIDRSYTKTYDYTIDTKNSVKTKSGTDMYGIDLTLTAASYHKGSFSGNDFSTGKKYYMIIGKNSKNLIFVDKVYNNTPKDRNNYMKNNLKNMSDNNESIEKFIKE